MKMILTFILLLTFCSNIQSSENMERKQPPVLIQEAINIAEKYVSENNIDVSKHFISAVRYQSSGPWTNSKMGKGPYWQITYELLQHSRGGEVFVFVYMDRKTGHNGGL